MGGNPQRNGAGARGPAQRARPDGATLGPVLEFMGALWSMDHALQSASKRMEARHGVTGPQRLVIRIVGRYPGISAGELAAILHLHPSTLTGVLKRLVGRGLLERVADPGDARRVLLRLTRRGRELNALKSGTVEQAVRRALAQVEPRTVHAARALAGAIAAELDRLG